VTRIARDLQQSALRRIVDTLLNWRDAMTYLFLPSLIVLVLSFPTLAIWSYLHVSRDERALRTIAESGADEAKVIELVREGPIRSMEGMAVQEVARLETPDFRGFALLSDDHIVDFRSDESVLGSWLAPHDGGVYQYRHFLVRKVAAASADQHLRFQFTSKGAPFRLRCLNPELNPMLKRMRLAAALGTEGGTVYRLELDLDFSRVPTGANVDVVIDGLLGGSTGGRSNPGRPLPHISHGDTKVATMWILLPQHRRAGRLELFAYANSRPQEKRAMQPTRQFEALGRSILGWQIIGLESDTTYEGHWILD
jgi:hypothetical protein